MIRSDFKRVHHFLNGSAPRGSRLSCVCGEQYHSKNMITHQTSCEAHLATLRDCSTCNMEVVGGIQEHYMSEYHRTHRRRRLSSLDHADQLESPRSPARAPSPAPITENPEPDDIPSLEHKDNGCEGMQHALSAVFIFTITSKCRSTTEQSTRCAVLYMEKIPT